MASKPVVIIAVVIFLLSVAVGRFIVAPPPPVRTVSADVALVHVVSTPTPRPVSPLRPVTGDAVRVQFGSGAYGTTLTGDTGTKYLLWAAAGQTFTVALRSEQGALASLYGVGGQPIYEQMAAGNTATAKLVASGDHTLQIQATGAYTVGVEIR